MVPSFCTVYTRGFPGWKRGQIKKEFGQCIICFEETGDKGAGLINFKFKSWFKLVGLDIVKFGQG